MLRSGASGAGGACWAAIASPHAGFAHDGEDPHQAPEVANADHRAGDVREPGAAAARHDAGAVGQVKALKSTGEEHKHLSELLKKHPSLATMIKDRVVAAKAKAKAPAAPPVPAAPVAAQEAPAKKVEAPLKTSFPSLSSRML